MSLYLMGTTSASHSAVPSAVGYYHQGLFALIVLLDGSDGATVSLETEDDLVLDDGCTTLHQLKHSMGVPAPLTVTNNGLWNTICNWCSGPFDGSVSFHFVTCAPVAATDELQALTQPAGDRTRLLAALEAEAKRVERERAAAAAGTKGASKVMPHAKRWSGCEAFLKLSPSDRKKLVHLMTITPNSFSAANVPEQVGKRIRSCVPLPVRDRLVERLIEWWDRQVVLSLLGRRARRITHAELVARIQALIVEHSAENLPDDFSLKEPPSMLAETGRVMEKQVALVKGGPSRLRRAVIARWRARNQRDEWLQRDLTAAADLDTFDHSLIEAWSDRFGPMKDDCQDLGEAVSIDRGRALLDWSHNDAHQALTPIRPLWTHAYLVQGSYQQLAEQKKVGWHPNYEALLKTGDTGDT